MKNPTFIILFFAAMIFASLYLGALKDIENRDQAIIEMKSILSNSQKAELRNRYENRQFLLERPGDDSKY